MLLATSSIAAVGERGIALIPKDRKKCAFIADIIILQCIVVGIGAVSILGCLWTPDYATLDYTKLTCIMYLYDSKACGYKLRKAKEVANLQLSNNTFGLDVLPIKYLPVIPSVSTRLSAKTRHYIFLSFIFHILWFTLALAFRIIMKNSSNVRLLKIALNTFYYSCVFIICFDLSMAAVYVTYIKQSLSKGMILRYSGWSTELILSNYSDFAGWLPIVASVCWLRGIVIFVMNVYFCRIMASLCKVIKKRELFKKKTYTEKNLPFPEAQQIEKAEANVLLYREGVQEPQIKYAYQS